MKTTLHTDWTVGDICDGFIESAVKPLALAMGI